jgi:hypothetical protein
VYLVAGPKVPRLLRATDRSSDYFLHRKHLPSVLYSVLSEKPHVRSEGDVAGVERRGERSFR